MFALFLAKKELQSFHVLSVSEKADKGIGIGLALVEPKKIFHPPLYIKLGLMKQFVKDGECFICMCERFSRLPNMFCVAPDVRKMMFYLNFIANDMETS